MEKITLVCIRDLPKKVLEKLEKKDLVLLSAILKSGLKIGCKVSLDGFHLYPLNFELVNFVHPEMFKQKKIEPFYWEIESLREALVCFLSAFRSHETQYGNVYVRMKNLGQTPILKSSMRTDFSTFELEAHCFRQTTESEAKEMYDSKEKWRKVIMVYPLATKSF